MRKKASTGTRPQSYPSVIPFLWDWLAVATAQTDALIESSVA